MPKSQGGSSNVGTLLRQGRERAHLSREALAAEIGISVSTVARAELSDQVPNFVTTTKIARRLGISLDELAASLLVEAASA